MIGSLRGIILQKSPGAVLVEVQGIGYEVTLPVASFDVLPEVGAETLLFISESVGMYGGGTTLYGFLSSEEKEIFLWLREVPGTGAKKALDYLDKIVKALPDFRRAILEGDTRVLVSLFGFSKKTAEKLIVGLKEPLAGWRAPGREKWSPSGDNLRWNEALAALVQLGFREPLAREALERLPADMRATASTAAMVTDALKYLS